MGTIGGYTAECVVTYALTVASARRMPGAFLVSKVFKEESCQLVCVRMNIFRCAVLRLCVWSTS